MTCKIYDLDKEIVGLLLRHWENKTDFSVLQCITGKPLDPCWLFLFVVMVIFKDTDQGNVYFSSKSQEQWIYSTAFDIMQTTQKEHWIE